MVLSFLYKKIVKPILFSLDPEFIHDRFMFLGSILGKCRISKYITKKLFHYKNKSLAQNYWGINFENPVGLSAGFDKDGKVYGIMDSVGFGFAEVGTVTYRPYEGNPKPRLKRLKNSKSLLVNYGLKNEGCFKVIERLKKTKKTIPQIISIGRTNSEETSELGAGIEDYYNCLNEFIKSGVGDVYEINISCPNTFGGEPFTNPDALEALLSRLFALEIKKPIFIKMPLNLDWDDFEELVKISLKFGIKGLVISNLNKDRENSNLKDFLGKEEKGNLSGKPTESLSNELISKTYKNFGDKIIIVGAGGIFSAKDAYEKIKRGASLVELITGMIYEGPSLIGDINRGLAKELKKDGFENIRQAIGAYHKQSPKI
jgi:dihydroorotate dehydrogenase